MDLIPRIEEALGKPFGPAPKVMPFTWQNTYDLYKRLTKSSKEPDRIAQEFASATMDSRGFYNHNEDTVFYNESDSSKDDFIALHEHCHARHSRLNQNLKYSPKTMHLGATIDIEPLLILNCLDEGLADYTAVQVHRLDAQRGANPSNLFGFTRDCLHMDYIKDVDPQRKISKQLVELEKEDSKKIGIIGSHLIRINEICLLERSMGRLAVYMNEVEKFIFEEGPYVIGYLSARFILKDQMAGFGNNLDQLLISPPKTFKELEELCAQ